LSRGFLGDGVLEVRVRDDAIGYEHGVCEAQDEEGDGWREGVRFGDWQEDEKCLEGGTDEEEGAQREVAVEHLCNVSLK